MNPFTLRSTSGSARRGALKTSKGEFQTPVFMPVGTKATVKAMTVEDLHQIGFEIILGNTYHLHLRPGEKIIKNLGGLHRFMNWNKSILTDSGGFQVFSLSKIRKLTEDGVEFRSHYDGAKLMLTPEASMEIQMDLGSDIIMAFDECTPFGAEKAEVQRSMELSMRWAERSRRAMTRKQSLFFGIVQGGMHLDLRHSSINTLKKLDCDGIALGGLSVGEPIPLMHEMLANTVPLLPADKPRYVMGVGTPLDLLVGIDAGVDMFDCVIPTRNARNGSVFTSTGTLSIKQAAYVEDAEPLDKNCRCKVCSSYSRAYLRHLYVNNEILSSQLLTFHNLFFYNNFISECRKAIEEDRWQKFFHEQKNLMMHSASASTGSI